MIKMWSPRITRKLQKKNNISRRHFRSRQNVKAEKTEDFSFNDENYFERIIIKS